MLVQTSFMEFQQADAWKKMASKAGPDENIIKGYLVTKVIDFGQGVGKKTMPQLFKTFSKKNDKEKGPFSTSGIGVGLSTSSNLVKSMGGSIHLQSCEGVGTEVTFSAACRAKVTQIMMDRHKNACLQALTDKKQFAAKKSAPSYGGLQPCEVSSHQQQWVALRKKTQTVGVVGWLGLHLSHDTLDFSAKLIAEAPAWLECLSLETEKDKHSEVQAQHFAAVGESGSPQVQCVESAEKDSDPVYEPEET